MNKNQWNSMGINGDKKRINENKWGQMRINGNKWEKTG